MFGATPPMKPLESQRQLLIVESELNRAQLVRDLTALGAGVRALTHRATSLGLIVSSAAVLGTGVAALQRGRTFNAGARPSRLDALFKGAVLISTLCVAYRAQIDDRRDQ